MFQILITLLPLWTVNVGDSSEAGYSSPVVTESRVYITGNENDCHTIFCFDHDGKLFISNGAGSDSKLLELHADGDKITAEIVWTNRLLANSHGGVVLIDGRLYGATNKKGSGFACIRFNDGADIFLDRKITRGSFALADDVFYILTEFGEIVVAKPLENDFAVLARLQLPEAEGGQAYAHPVVKGNRLYLRIGEK